MARQGSEIDGFHIFEKKILDFKRCYQFRKLSTAKKLPVIICMTNCHAGDLDNFKLVIFFNHFYVILAWICRFLGSSISKR